MAKKTYPFFSIGMKIGIEVQRLFRKERFGIEHSALELITELPKLNSDNEFIIFAKSNSNKPGLTNSPNLKICYVWGKLFFDFEQFFLPIAAFRKNVDILHCTGNTAPLFCKKPIILTLHDVIFMDHIPGTDTIYQRFGNYYRRFIAPIVAKKSKAIITVSNYSKQNIVARLGLDERKVHVIYNGINERFRKIENVSLLEHVKSKYQLPDKFILFLGNSSHRKNPHRVLNAYLEYRNKVSNPLPLVAPSLSRKFIKSQAESIGQLSCINHILSPGYIDADDLPALYSQSEIFLFPSISEGFGMPVLEAMACGVPVITSNISSLPEIAGNAALLVNPLNSHSISDAIIMLTENPNLMLQYSELGLQQAKKFSWKITAERTLEVYRQIISEINSLGKFEFKS